MSTYEPQWNLAHYLCPVCSQKHPMDPITFTAECPSMDLLRQRMFNAWPPRFDLITTLWWEAEDVTNRRHFIRTLVPHSLADMLASPPSWEVLD